jgi:hypothetical protein
MRDRAAPHLPASENTRLGMKEAGSGTHCCPLWHMGCGEVSWRWRAAVEVFGRYPCRDGADELEAWFPRHGTCQQQVLAGMIRIDPAFADPHRASVWVTTITEDYSQASGAMGSSG